MNMCKKETDAIASEEALETNSSIWFVKNTTIRFRSVYGAVHLDATTFV